MVASTKQDFYQVLGLSKGATEAQLKKAYRKLAKQWHPDKHQGSSKVAAEEKFKIISEAYDVLSDPERRKVYDAYGHEGLSGGGAPGNAGTRSGGPNVFFSSGGSGRSPEDIFREIFGGAGGFKMDTDEDSGPSPFGARMGGMGGMGGFQSQGSPFGGFQSQGSPFGGGGFGGFRPQQQERPHVQVKRRLPCTLEELYRGFSKKMKITKKIQDSQSGAVTTATNVVTVEGRPGWKIGTKITFKGAGDELTGQPRQDIVFEIQEKPHSTFKRDGDNLETTVQVSLKDALCGTTVRLTDLAGKPVTLDMPRITPDTVMTMAGRGMPRKKGGYGDLKVRFKVDFPLLSPNQKDTISRAL